MYQKKPEIGKGVDWLMVWLFAILVLIGLVCIFSVEYRSGDGVVQSFLGFKKNYSVVNADLDHVFTTSEESDIKELIDDGKKIEEIISIIFQW